MCEKKSSLKQGEGNDDLWHKNNKWYNKLSKTITRAASILGQEESTKGNLSGQNNIERKLR